MSSPLISLNSYIRQDNGVFTTAGETSGFFYSDGNAEEEYIAQVLRRAQDLSSCSDELRRFERDWASECHLSAKRANVYRGLDLTGITRVLEVGSGCGAISRFLGEMGFVADCVEGSARRAEITRLRCRDLDNVTVVQADFNTMQLPVDYYDLVLLTGVIEYAGCYAPGDMGPDEAARHMIQRLMRCLAPGGRLLVAIENRIGFKYLAGASEDHFARPFVGLSDYPRCKAFAGSRMVGVRTWDRRQWLDLVNAIPEVHACDWYYPFPDYKMADLLLSPHFLAQHPDSASALLSRIRSRDYTATWHPQLEEALFWQTMVEAGAIEALANSFVLVLSKGSPDQGGYGGSIIPFDFVHFSGYSRKPEFRLVVTKERDNMMIRKRGLVPAVTPTSQAVVRQVRADEPFLPGRLLSQQWAAMFRACPDAETADTLFSQYHAFLNQACEETEPAALLDLLPCNIIVGHDGEWHFFDQEWHVRKVISPEFIFFRGILYFFIEYKELLWPICEKAGLENGRDFLLYCLERNLPTSGFDLEEFVDLEEEIQGAIAQQPSPHLLRQILTIGLEEKLLQAGERVELVWGQKATASSPEACRPASDGEHFCFRLPPEAATSTYFQLRLFLPKEFFDRVFLLPRFTLSVELADGRQQVVFSGSGKTFLPPLMHLTGLSIMEENDGHFFIVEEQAPQALHFESPMAALDKSHHIVAVRCEFSLSFREMTGTALRLRKLQAEKQSLDIEKRSLETELWRTMGRLQEIEHSRGWKILSAVRKARAAVAGLLPANRDEASSQSPSDEQGSSGEQSPSAEQDTAVNKPVVSPPLFSVLLVTFNTDGEELCQTVESVLAQTWADWELIVLDSGSDSGVTLAALRGLQADRIKVHFLRKRVNVPEALNQGLMLARGRWVTCLGQFDRFMPDALEKVAGKVESGSVDLVYFDEEIVDRYCNRIRIWQKEGFGPDYSGSGDPLGSCFFIRRELARTLGGFDPEIDGVHLFDLALRAMRKGAVLLHGKEVLYRGRQFEEPSEAERSRLQSCLRLALRPRENEPGASPAENG